MDKHVLIYDDQGVSSQCVRELRLFFEAENISVKIVSGADLQKKEWMDYAKLLIIPGGRSLPFYDALGAIGNQHIMTFVQKGGCYIGFCAGAYYACRETVFAKDLSHELILPGALHFFDGKAIGPVFSADKFDYDSEQGASAVSITTQNGQIDGLYFNGGCYFDVTDAHANTRIVARYQSNQLPAIIDCAVEQGKVILSGIHPELSYRSIPVDDNVHHQALRDTLYQHDASRLALLRELITMP